MITFLLAACAAVTVPTVAIWTVAMRPRRWGRGAT